MMVVLRKLAFLTAPAVPKKASTDLRTQECVVENRGSERTTKLYLNTVLRQRVCGPTSPTPTTPTHITVSPQPACNG
eukprot:729468-Amphidinium_carterae.1